MKYRKYTQKTKKLSKMKCTYFVFCNILYFLSTNNETIRSHYYLCDAVTPPRSLQPGEQADCAHQRLMCSTTFLWVLVW